MFYIQGGLTYKMLGSAQKLLLAFLTLIVGVVLIGTIASNSLNVTTLSSVSDESHSLTDCYTGDNEVNESDSDCNITVTHAPSGWVSSEGLGISSVTVKNGTGTALTEDTDYVLFETQGLVQFLNTSDTDDFTSNLTYIDYKYYPEDYLNLGWGRTLVNLVAGFFAIALLLVSVALFYSVAKENNLIR